ncbi:MAG: hypothetical protein K6E13_08220 [Lachnospiraceae bacterium]|nr:hypothetical protein [Lachnospiraceae bacterium]
MFENYDRNIYKIANKITDPDTGKSCYPDLFALPFFEDELSDKKAYEKAKKLLSERGSASFVCFFSEQEIIFEEMQDSGEKRKPLDDRIEKLTDRFKELFKCSDSMSVALENIIHYLCLKTDDEDSFCDELVSKMEREDLLPCRDKKDAKKCLEYLKREVKLLESDSGTESDLAPARKAYSHIYIEKDIAGDTETKRILEQFKNAKIIYIDDCKDIFFRKNQDIISEENNKSLILARQHAKLMYPGAPVCQSFGNEHFYYTSCVKNCIYDCEYCYLKGMYPSGHTVVYVDLKSVFEEVRQALKLHPVYLCVSYDTDLLALENILHFVERWVDFTLENENLRIEVRTKSANEAFFKNIKKCDRVYYAFTISPEEISKKYEKSAPGLRSRLQTAKTAAGIGHKIRLCFDPMICVDGWEKMYRAMLDTVWEYIDPEDLNDVSVGAFRISSGYLKKMRKAMYNSEIVWYPYEISDGYYMYPKDIAEDMTLTFTNWLAEKINKMKIFV